MVSIRGGGPLIRPSLLFVTLLAPLLLAGAPAQVSCRALREGNQGARGGNAGVRIGNEGVRGGSGGISSGNDGARAGNAGVKAGIAGSRGGNADARGGREPFLVRVLRELMPRFPDPETTSLEAPQGIGKQTLVPSTPHSSEEEGVGGLGVPESGSGSTSLAAAQGIGKETNFITLPRAGASEPVHPGTSDASSVPDVSGAIGGGMGAPDGDGEGPTTTMFGGASAEADTPRTRSSSSSSSRDKDSASSDMGDEDVTSSTTAKSSNSKEDTTTSTGGSDIGDQGLPSGTTGSSKGDNLGITKSDNTLSATKSDDGPDTTSSLDACSGEQCPLNRRLLTLVNGLRQAHKLPTVCLNNKLIRAAKAHAEDMRAARKFSLTGSDGSQYWDRVRAAGFHMQQACKRHCDGENVAQGLNSPEDVFNAWERDPDYRMNLLNEAQFVGAYRAGQYWAFVLASSASEPCNN